VGVYVLFGIFKNDFNHLVVVVFVIVIITVVFVVGFVVVFIAIFVCGGCNSYLVVAAVVIFVVDCDYN